MAFFVLADMDKRRATYRTIGQVVLELGVLLVGWAFWIRASKLNLLHGRPHPPPKGIKQHLEI